MGKPPLAQASLYKMWISKVDSSAYTTDGKKSFSIYKSILVVNRKSFKLENLEMYMICICNAFSDVNDE